ncbi:hypothetical protein [Streptomyces sp. NPDC057494]|uniref:hypothetical protein n=1 Tax=Streptomyces sp. NPDC057494 TaxID=3346148 RepID=UPI0036832CDC
MGEHVEGLARPPLTAARAREITAGLREAIDDVRLLDVARSLTAIHSAVAASAETSRMRDTGPAATAALDYGLSHRALIAISSRMDVVSEP